MRAEKILWWILGLLFVVASVLVFLHLMVITAAYPEVAAFLVGLVGFWLFANRLIFGYGSLANTAAAFVKGQELAKEDLAAKIRHPVSKLEDFSVAALLTLWQNQLEPFKYAYYLAFFLVFVCAMLFEMDLLGGGLPGIVAKGLMMGAAIPSLLVFGLDLLASHYVAACFRSAA